MNEVECALEVDVDNRIPLLFCHAHHERVLSNPSVVDEDIDAPKLSYDFFN